MKNGSIGSSRARILSTLTPLALVAMGCLTSCSQPDDTSEQEKGSVGGQSSCDGCELPLTAVQKHERADAVFRWSLGGAHDLLAAYPQRTGTPQDWATFRTQVDRFRQLLQNSFANQADGYCDGVAGDRSAMPSKGPIHNASNSPTAIEYETRPVPSADQIETNHFFVTCSNLSTADRDMLLPARRYWRSEYGGSYSDSGLQATMLKVWGDPGAPRTPSTEFDGTSNYGPEIWWQEEGNVEWLQDAAGRWRIKDGQSMVFDPAPAQLDYNLSAEWQYATYTDTHAATYGFKQTKNWVWHPWMPSYAGYACIDYNAAAGTILYGYLIASGNYVKCTGW